MRNVIGMLLVGLVVGLVSAGCGGGGGGGGEATAGGESAYAGPVGSTDVAHGQARYEAVCGSCHNNGAPQLANIGWSPERMRQQIREGDDDMPAISESRLSAEDMEAVLAYLQTIGGVTGGAEPMPASSEETAAPAEETAAPQ